MAKVRKNKDTQIGALRAMNPNKVLKPDIPEMWKNEEATILTDFNRQYVGVAKAISDSQSAVFMNTYDAVINTQNYNDKYFYALYDELENDPHIASILMVRKLAVAGLEWNIVVDSEDEKDIEIAQITESKLRKIETFTQDMIELLDSILKGFAISEIIWGLDNEGYVCPLSMYNRPQRRFQFDAVSREPKLRKMGNMFYGDPVTPQKFVVHRNYSKYENPFGDAMGQKLFWGFLFKKMIQKFWLGNLETAMASVPIVQHPKTADENIKAEALNIAEQIRNGSYGRIPLDWQLLWAQAPQAFNSTLAYESALRFYNEEATKCVLGQMLSTEAGGSSGGGSRALGGVHNLVRTDILEYDSKALASTFTNTLVRWFVDKNFSNVKTYPRFNFVLDEGVNILMQSQIIQNFSNAGYVVNPAYIEDELDFPLIKAPMMEKNENGDWTKIEMPIDESGASAVGAIGEQPTDLGKQLIKDTKVE